MQINTKKRNIMMIILLAGAFISLLAETFLNNALVTIMRTFQVSQTTVQWLSTGYLLIVGVMIPLSAWIFERFSTRRSYLVMLFIFIIGSLLCLSASNFYILLGGRLIEAVAAGALMPFVQNVILKLFAPQQRGVAVGMTGLVIAFGPAVGPTISGIILKYYDWRMLFIILTVASTIVFLCAFFGFYKINNPHKTNLDWLSFAEAIVGFGMILFIFSEIGNTGKITLIESVLFLIGIVFLILFGKRQLQLTQPLLNIRVLLNRQFNWATTLSTLSNLAMVGIELVLPLYLQTTRNETALSTGLIMMPGAIIMGLFNPLSGYLFDKFGVRIISFIGFIALLLGTIPMAFFTAHTSILLIVFSYAIRMMGIALTMMTTFTAGINALDETDTAYGNAVSSTIRQIGGSLGTAISMTIVSLGSLTATNRGLSPQLATEIGYHWTFDFMIVIAILGILISFKLPVSCNSTTKRSTII
ncbi:MDR family MFS transporter [Bombilactobacillus bombi]|uniref:MDR family MFS transporter n=1 Tax=Bombilactobacillus bombi TaxID=1303590 RepID=UPI002159E884|nr:MDR family MFS transporter [Bombilactobacillus bombi]